MRRICATLPALGTIPVDFHLESEAVLDFLGERELTRLRRVPHLGVASVVFAGVNHSRLEYMLLQCALIGLVAKLNKNHEFFATANRVQLSGIKDQISSGEELLKVWAILSNSGHAHYTYGSERGLLQCARKNTSLMSWLLDDVKPRDLREWCNDVFWNYDDSNFHFILAIKRINMLPQYDRRKAKFLHYIRNLVISDAKLVHANPANSYKIGRLRYLFQRIRLLSIVALDSYYSPHPIRVNVVAALTALAEACSVGEEHQFHSMLTATAGWLADDLYLHPKAVAALRDYELRVAEQCEIRYERARLVKGGMINFLNGLLFAGFGRPFATRVIPLLRLTFNNPRHQFLGRQDLSQIVETLQDQLTDGKRTIVAVNRNPFSEVLHMDVAYHHAETNASQIAAVYVKVGAWLIKQLDGAALERLKTVIPGKRRPFLEDLDRLRQRYFRQRYEKEMILFYSIFESFIKYLLPEGKRGTSSVIPSDKGGGRILVKLVDKKNVVYDDISSEIADHLSNNLLKHGQDRLQEWRALNNIVQTTSGALVVACIHQFIVRDEFGKTIDEWDGVVLDIGKDRVRLYIVEAKNVGSGKQNENQAFQQLNKTQKLLCWRRVLFIDVNGSENWELC